MSCKRTHHRDEKLYSVSDWCVVVPLACFLHKTLPVREVRTDPSLTSQERPLSEIPVCVTFAGFDVLHVAEREVQQHLHSIRHILSDVLIPGCSARLKAVWGNGVKSDMMQRSFSPALLCRRQLSLSQSASSALLSVKAEDRCFHLSILLLFSSVNVSSDWPVLSKMAGRFQMVSHRALKGKNGPILKLLHLSWVRCECGSCLDRLTNCAKYPLS